MHKIRDAPRDREPASIGCLGGVWCAEYGDRLLERLSRDLSAQYGAGFSVVNLGRMRTFYFTHRKCSTSNKLGWSQHVVIRSYASDAFGRFLADVFCFEEPVATPSVKTFDQILSSGIFLNQDLLAKRLAVRMIS